MGQPGNLHDQADAILFSVDQDDKFLAVEPIAKLVRSNGIQFPTLEPPVDFDRKKPGDLEEFKKRFLQSGNRVETFRGGANLGSGTLGKSIVSGDDEGCVQLSTILTTRSTPSPFLAATPGAGISNHRSTRRSANSGERNTLMRLGKQFLLANGRDPSSLQTAKLGPVISTQLRNRAGQAIIGRIDVEVRVSVHRLFLIAEQVNGEYRLTLSLLEYEPDINADKGEVIHTYLDQLDLNGDGADEVIMKTTLYETWFYSIWQFDSSQQEWRKIYAGGGGGC